jgi:sugar/nucleoside kinase (ribokinase family)
MKPLLGKYVGGDGRDQVIALQEQGIDCRHLRISDRPSGHAIIQVADNGENSILVHAGANGCVEPGAIEAALAEASARDVVLLQDETSSVAHAITAAHARGLPVVLTLGRDGALFADQRQRLAQAAFPAEVVDTTAAGDTFIGYFLASWLQRRDPPGRGGRCSGQLSCQPPLLLREAGGVPLRLAGVFTFIDPLRPAPPPPAETPPAGRGTAAAAPDG